MCCSAIVLVPFDRRSSAAAERQPHSRRVRGRAAEPERDRGQQQRQETAARDSSGGSSRTPRRIARKVEPQTR
jgi:hypothetical protein